MAKPKRTKAEEEADYEIIAPLYHQKNLSQKEIAAIVSSQRDYTLTRQTIARDIAAIKKIWGNAPAADLEAQRNEMESHYKYLIAQLYNMLSESKKDKIIKTINAVIVGGVVENGVMSGGSIRERNVSERTEKQIGDKAIFAEIRAILKDYKDLRGLDAAKKTELTGANGAALLPENMKPSEIAERARAMIKNQDVNSD